MRTLPVLMPSKGLFFAVLYVSFTSIAAETNPVPADFKLYAEYLPGFSDSKPWKLTITADGNALQKTSPPRSGKPGAAQKTFTLTAKDLQELLAVAEESRFTTLKKRYTYDVTDNPTLILRITKNGRSHEVEVYAPGLLENDDEVKRFLKLWNEVLKKVAAPNPEQRRQ